MVMRAFKTAAARRAAAGQQYAIIVGVIAVISLAAIATAGKNINFLMGKTSNTLTQVVNDTVGAAPVVLDAIPAFTDLNSQTPNTLVTSGSVTVTVAGNGTASASLSGTGSPQMNINGTGWVAGPANISSGQTLQLRLTTANAGSTARAATVSFGTASTTWTATTQAVSDSIPAFTDLTGQVLNSQVTSGVVTVAVAAGTATISVTGAGSPQMNINGGGWVSGPASINNGDTLQLRQTTANAGTTARTATVSFNAASTTWTVTTQASTGTIPAFTDLTSQPISTQVVSNTVTVTVSSGTPTISVSGSGSPQLRVAGGSWVTSTTISNGQTLQLRQTTGASGGNTVTATVTMGSTTATWNATTASGATYLIGTFNGTDIFLAKVCASGDYYCQAQKACEAATGATCSWQSYTCSTYPNQNGSFYPTSDPRGMGISTGGSSNLNWTVTSAWTTGGNTTSGYGNLCACYNSGNNWKKNTHTYCGVGRWEPY